MNVANTLLTFAIDKIWSNPNGSKNVVYQSNKLTGTNGAVSSVSLPWGNESLPISNRIYGLLELAVLPFDAVGLNITPYTWLPFQTFINNYQTLVVGVCQGRLLTMAGTYIKFKENGSCLIAYDLIYNSLINKLNDTIYIRFYTNIFYDGNSPTTAQKVVCNSFVNAGNNNYIYNSFNNSYNALATANTIPPSVFKNGLLLPSGLPSYSTLLSSDIVEYVSDPFLIAVNNYTLSTLPVYTSALDSVNKVIVSIDNLEDDIYVSDTEFFIVGTKANGTLVGAYFPRLSIEFIRMLTYKDWGLDAPKVTARLSELEAFSDVNQTLSNVQVYVYRRENNQNKPITLDSNYIPDLMNLPTATRIQALTGVNSVMAFWNAVNLESSPYNTWISNTIAQLNTSTISTIFSRYSALNILEAPQLNASNQWTLPANAGVNGGTLVSYGTNGIGVTFTTYSAGSIAGSSYSNGTGYEMFFPGDNSTESLDLVVTSGYTGTTVVPYGFAIFCYYLNGSTLHYAQLGIDYTVVKTSSTITITWNPAVTGFERYVRTAQSACIYSVSLTQSQIESGFDVYNGRPKSHDIGMGNIYIWYNGTYLIESLDYKLRNGLVYLTGRPSNWSNPATLQVVYAGLPSNTLQHIPNTNWGWVEHGIIQNDGSYDLNLYRNKIPFVAGRMIGFSELNLKENLANLVSVTDPVTVSDGSPYCIANRVQFTDDTDLDPFTYTMAYEINQDINTSNYLSTINPIPQNNTTVIIAEKYQLVSNILNKLISDIVSAAYVVSGQTPAILAAVQSTYATYLAVDPCNFSFDFNYADILPRWDTTPVNLTIAQYSFLVAVNNTLLGNQVQGLNLFVNIVP